MQIDVKFIYTSVQICNHKAINWRVFLWHKLQSIWYQIRTKSYVKSNIVYHKKVILLNSRQNVIFQRFDMLDNSSLTQTDLKLIEYILKDHKSGTYLSYKLQSNWNQIDAKSHCNTHQNTSERPDTIYLTCIFKLLWNQSQIKCNITQKYN